jgi:prephenate dehydratase
MRIAFLGPRGTFTHEALTDALAGDPAELVPCPTIFDAVVAVHEGRVDRALVPIENSLEGSVNATLDALVFDAPEVRIVGETVYGITQCLIARRPLELDEIEVVVSHPQATAQCARFIRTRLPQARVHAGLSTADAVRMLSEQEGPWAALGTRVAAEQYGCVVLRSGVEDVAGNETRFVWLAGAGAQFASARSGPWKTAIVFWGVGSEAPGWLVNCLSEFARRSVNLTRIESRPRKQGLGRYMFFADLEGREDEPHVADALAALREHVERLRVLGSFPVG